MSKIFTHICIAASLFLMVPYSFASNYSSYVFKDKLFSIMLPASMTLRNEYRTPNQVKDVREDVFVLAHYGAQDKKAAVTGALDPQLRSIIPIRHGKFDLQTGAAVTIVFLVERIRQRRGLPFTVKERLDTYHAIKSATLGGKKFKTYTLRIKSSPIIYKFYAGVIDQRLVSMIWTVYSKHSKQLTYYSNLASQAMASFKLLKST